MANAPLQPHQRFNYFELPSEIRNEIYNYIFPAGKRFLVSLVFKRHAEESEDQDVSPFVQFIFYGTHPAAQVLRVSKRMKDEASFWMSKNVRGTFETDRDPDFTIIAATWCTHIDKFVIKGEVSKEINRSCALRFPNLSTLIVECGFWTEFWWFLNLDDEGNIIDQSLQRLDDFMIRQWYKFTQPPSLIGRYIPESWIKLKNDGQLGVEVIYRLYLSGDNRTRSRSGNMISQGARVDYDWREGVCRPAVHSKFDLGCRSGCHMIELDEQSVPLTGPKTLDWFSTCGRRCRSREVIELEFPDSPVDPDAGSQTPDV